MTDAEAQALFQAFAAPLYRHATTQDSRENAARLARNLWLVVILDEEMEQRLWQGLKNTMKLDDNAIEAIQQCYAEKMKPLVGEEQRAALRVLYQIKRKG